MPLSATIGDGITYTWSVVTGSLPPGISLRTDVPSSFPASASAGLIGIAAIAGTYDFTLRVTSGGESADRVCTLKVTALTTKEKHVPDAFAGVAYSYSLSALGNIGPALWSPPSGVPAGMTLGADGLLSGTPTSAGTYNLSFTVSDGTDTVNQVLSVNVFAITITTPGRLPNAVQNVFYTTTIAASGGVGGYTFTANGLPNELSIDFYTGDISGMLSSGGSSVGNFSFSVTASDSASVSYTKTMSIDVVGSTPTLPTIVPSNSNIYDCTLGVPCYRTISVLNGGSAPFTWTASGLPAGMSIRSGSGTTTSYITPGDAQLWGTPTTIGSFNVQLSVTDALSVTVIQTFPMKVSPLLQTTFLQNGMIDTAYSQTLRVLGGTGPYTVVQTAGQLPAGLTVNSGAFALSGTPVESGNNFSPVFTYTDSASHTLQIDSSLFISDHGSGVSIYTSTLSPATDGSSYSYQLSSCCAESIVWSQIGGTLPPGLLFLQGGLLTGTPAATTSTYTFLLKAADYFDAAKYAARQFTLNVLNLRPRVALNAARAVPGQSVTATVTNGPGNAWDWVGLYLVGAPSAPANRFAYQFLNGQTTAPASGVNGATLTFTLPNAPGSYEVRLFLNGSFTVLATSGAITMAGIALNATMAVPGQSVTATVTNGPANAWDWVGLYPVGTPSAPANRLAYQFLNGQTTAPVSGVSAATLTFTLPIAPGSYEVRFFSNGSFTVLATSGAITIAPPSVALNAARAVPGQSVTATVTNGPGNAWDWVGLYPVGAPSAPANRLAYQFLNGQTTAPASGVNGATLTFTLPSTPGGYEVRLFLNGSFTVLATSGAITIAGIALNAATAVPGQSVTATVTNGPGNAWDWVGLYSVGAPSTPANRLAYQFLNGQTTAPASGVTGATLTFSLPTTPGSYEVRFFLNGSFTVLATSGATTIALPSVALNAATAVPGQSVTATVTNGPGNTWDWVGLYPAGATSATANRLAYQFLNGQTTAPASGVGAATLTFALPSAPGSYDVRLFLNGSFTVLATSGAIRVALPSVALNAATAAPGQSVAATVTNGPGNAWDWVGLYPTGTTSATANRLAYKFLNGQTTAPASGVTGATLIFTLPSAPGSYEVRLFLNGSFTVVATSGTITIAPPSVALSAATAGPGQTVTATVTNGPGNAWDWVGLYPAGATSATANRLAYQFLNGQTTAPASGVNGATLTFTLPSAPGSYDVRLFLNGSFTVLATSAAIAVTP
jgi:hypothetical protein